MVVFPRVLVALSVLFPLLAQATELYRYRDDKGVMVLDRGVPPEYIGKGYDVINEQGRVVREVPPAPSPEEIRQRLAAQAQARSDAQMLKLYTSVEDVERARDRRLAELDSLIGVTRGNLQSLRTQQGNLNSQAAQHERANRQVPEHLLVQLDNLKREQETLQHNIERYQQLREKATAEFAADRERLSLLLGGRQ